MVVIAAASVFAGIRWLGTSRAATVRAVPVGARTEGGGGTVLNASGYVTARRRATVSSKITGKLVEVSVEEGMPVRGGQVLARLDDSLFRRRLELAESQSGAARRAVEETESLLALAEITLGRTRRLVEAGVTGEAELDSARTEVESLRARLAREREEVLVAEREVALRRTELSDTVVRAPFDGVVISKDAQPGEMISPVSAGGGFTRTGICTIVDMGSLEIEVDVNESYISRVESGQRVEAVLDAYPDWRIPATVITTVPAADRQKATVLVRIGFDELDPRILPDMGIKVAFLDQGVPAASGPRTRLFVPRSAVGSDGGGDAVWVIEDGRAHQREVRLGAAAGDDVEVVSGLSAGERVVVEGTEGLSEGDNVSVR